MWNSYSNNGNTNTLQDCRVIQCQGGDECGGVLAWRNKYNVGVSNTVKSGYNDARSEGSKMSL